MEQLAKLIMGIAFSLLVIGALLYILARFGISKLPGDIYFKKGNFSLFFPLTTSILLSIIFSLLMRLFRR